LLRATGEDAAIAEDLVSCLSKAVAAARRPPKIVTFGASPVSNTLAHVFGPGAVETLLVRPAAIPDEAARVSRADGAPGSLHSIDPAAFANIARFVDGETFDRLREAHHPWLMRAAAIVLQFQPNARQADGLASGGFAPSRPFTIAGRPASVFLPKRKTARPARGGAALMERRRPSRLVIVDPCLGRAAGHYEAYARMLTEGAQDLGLGVVWACHAGLAEGLAPAGVEVRRCFRKCFFDLADDEAGTVDLSPALGDGWRSLLAEFDGADTQFLMHSADAHQLRAAAAVFEAAAPPRGVVHINFQTSPRFMPGRLAGGGVHAAVTKLRESPAWERSLFFWAETRRLAAWLSEWLGDDIPAPPFLSAWRESASPRRGPGDRLTLAFLGEARESKGFLDLPDIADHIAAHASLDGALRLMIQNWAPFRGDLHKHAAAIARLSRHPFVEIVDGVLAPAAYEALMDQANLLLLPYDPRVYGWQGSGILVEGLARGKIIIARGGTAAIDEARAGVGFAYQTPQDLADGLAEVVDGYDDLAATAVELAERFRENNNPRRFVSALEARSRGLTWRA
jgi:glycosyltransferase involved in cell wall biosynthesis